MTEHVVTHMRALDQLMYLESLTNMRVVLDQNKNEKLLLAAFKVQPVFFAEAALLLIGNGTSVNAMDKNGRTVLLKACLRAHSEVQLRVVLALLRKDAYIDTRLKNGWTALMYVCEAGYLEVLHALLFWGADKEITNKTISSSASTQ
jgi:ankyrin repeat protein